MNKVHDLNTQKTKYNVGLILDKAGILIVLVVMCIALSLATPHFLAMDNLLNVLRQITFTALIGYGVMAIIIVNGIDLSSGSVVGLSSIVFGYCVNANMPVIVTFILTVSVGIFVGLINGSVVAATGMPPFIVTLFTYTSVRGVAYLLCNGQPVHLVNPANILFFGQGVIFGIPFPIIILAVVTILLSLIMSYTKYGKHVYATGGSEQAAIISGINVKGLKIVIFTVAGLLSGITGFILTSRVQSGQPALGIGFELDAIAAAVIGGTSFSGGIGTIFGVLIGALVLGVMYDGMTLLNISSYWQQIAKGLIIVGAVYLDFVRRGLREKVK